MKKEGKSKALEPEAKWSNYDQADITVKMGSRAEPKSVALDWDELWLEVKS